MKVWCIFVSVVVAVKAGYHEEVGIPLALKIQEYEDTIADEGSGIKFRIAGAKDAMIGDHPHMVGLIIRLKTLPDSSVCGGALVNVKSIVTVAHCVHKAKSLTVVLGSQYLFKNSGIRITTKDFVKHPLYRHSRFIADYDIAIVKLPAAVTLSDVIQPINLPSTKDEAGQVGEWAMVTGWGLTGDKDENVSRETSLKQVYLQIIPEVVCKFRLPFCTHRVGNNVCTSGEGGRGVCRGDSGAPLYVTRHEKKILVGVASYANATCELGHPAAFTDVYIHLDFIEKHI